jgi:hypothetical protein
MYKTFRLDEIFEKVKTNTLPYKAKELPTKPDGKYVLPALTAGIENQGLSCFVPRDNATILKNCISVSANGANTGAMFYQPNEFTVLQDSYALRYKGAEVIGEKEYLYLISVMQKIIKGNFDWSNKAGWERIRSLEISLPVREVEEIDFEYMEARIKELEEARIKELEEARIKELEEALRVMGLHDTKLTKKEEDAILYKPTFKKFKVGDLFTAQTGDVDLQQKDVNGKGVFFINSGLSNCGIKGKTDKPAKMFPSNTITVDFWGNAFYRDFEYKMATHNHVFSLAGDVIKNERVGLYLVVQMSYFKNCFSYTNMGTWTKIKELEIELPVTDSNEFDFEYMENYIFAIEKQTIQKLYDDKGILIDATKKII